MIPAAANAQDRTPGPGILCVGGSPRKGGNSDLMVDVVSARLLQRQVPCEVIRLREYGIAPCIGCEACRKDHRCRGHRDDMQALYPKIVQSRGMVLVSPTHHYNITAWMKAFIDRMYCFYRFGSGVPRAWSSCLAGQGRIAAAVAVCEQQDKKDMGFTLEAMTLPLRALGYEVMEEVAVFKVFEKGGVTARPDVTARLEQMADHLADGDGRA